MAAKPEHPVLDAWCELQTDEPPRVPDAPILYHYTDAFGLSGIITSHKLWATAAQFSNDLSEIDYAVSVASEIVEETWSGKQNLGPWEQLLLSHLRQMLGTPLHTFGQPFIACFCQEGDLLSQWRGYGKDCGFSIAFKPIVQNEMSQLACQSGTRTVVRKINYDPNWQRKRLRQILKVFTALVNGFKHPIDSDQGHALHVELSLILILELTDWACAVKHKAFEAEQEWRIVTYPKGAMLTGVKEESYEGVSVQPTSRLLRPYMQLNANSSKHLPLVEIRCGPSPLQEQSGRGLKILLRNNGYKDVSVVFSEVPLRV